ncbi:MAG: hypothetical protein Tsb0015_08370 [Simkaniaceae bacterium]
MKVTLLSLVFFIFLLPSSIKSSSELDAYIEKYYIGKIEGHVDSEQIAYLTQIIKDHGCCKIGEIGFNAGHSSEAFLKINKKITVVSFDIMAHDYCLIAKEFIDFHFPERHLLIEGDSSISIPKFKAQHPSLFFDLIFIDGGHSKLQAKKDLVSMRQFSNKNTIVVLDDLHLKGPSQAWEECKKEGIIKETQRYKAKNSRRYWGVGKYIIK